MLAIVIVVVVVFVAVVAVTGSFSDVMARGSVGTLIGETGV